MRTYRILVFCASVASILLLSCRKTDTKREPVVFNSSWESLEQYKCPEWFRDAKFGLWSHWNGYVVPETGDWYARNMYIQGRRQYKLRRRLLTENLGD